MDVSVLITAWAKVAITVAIGAGATVACVLIWRGLQETRRLLDEEARGSAEAWEAEWRRHKKAMAHLTHIDEVERRRHNEAMARHNADLERISAR